MPMRLGLHYLRSACTGYSSKKNFVPSINSTSLINSDIPEPRHSLNLVLLLNPKIVFCRTIGKITPVAENLNWGYFKTVKKTVEL
ncbi:hypothetical protein AAE02nite_39180 [Adhaeribacter aerolatus]|uniref:Uncharacterized protein n=1 Tax=Adhaeribacter aerolatus TaxID=670289 RepID=A0A512B2T6_9BACT|nr:hypothetical protein AAE02nite_39180 [Adhaeribacter aerolatus]